MIYYVDWAYYNANFPQLTEARFYAALPAAQMQLDILTADRIKALPHDSYKLERAKAALCRLMNLQASYTAQGTGVSSLSNGGYTESYAAVSPQDVAQNERAAVCGWLSGTGLAGAL